ncbi:MAG TPA: carbohydrate porin [Burkholderiales bacterium]|nr:carbohydrate porin [Burkholderiales bacterium]
MRTALATLIAFFGTVQPVAAEEFAIEAHAQVTYLRQYKPSFNSPYSGPNSLSAAQASSYSFTSTLYLGAKFGDGWEVYLNPEATQGVPFSQLRGTAGFTNGEIARTSGPSLRGYFARVFVRKTWNLEGEWEDQASEANQVATRYAADRIVLTAGAISVLDLFDAVDYSRDARTQFMSWASLTYGAWDYPADSRGYTRGVALEYISPAWSLRAGRFMQPLESNGLRLDSNLGTHYGDVLEGELAYKFFGRPAVARGLVFRNRVIMGAFNDAIALGASTGTAPDLAQVRHVQSKRGAGIGTQVEVTPDIGAYVRAALNDGRTETYAFTEIDRSIAFGTLVKGALWSRPQDSFGVAMYLNGLRQPHRDYLAAGGQGFFLGDGRLNYASEQVLETFYSFGLIKGAWFSFGYQRMANPGYNRDRGPVDFLGFRLHAEL